MPTSGPVDDAAPGLVAGLYVTGSVALDDYRPAISDIDLVAISRGALSASTVDALAALQQTIPRGIDVVYATRNDLRRDPSQLSLPCSIGGEFRREGAFDANPAVWRVLSTKAISVRGTPLTPEDVWFDADILRRWNVGNLDGYWADWVQWKLGSGGGQARFEYGLQWLVLGVPRLHYTIATLDIISKTASGHYAIEVAPRHSGAVLEAAIALRVDKQAPLPSPPEVLWRDAIDLSAWLIVDAHRLLN